MQSASYAKASPHAPVMLTEVMEALDVNDGEIYVDGTFGAGGYSRAMLETADCHVYAIDRDPSAIKRADDMKQQYNERFTFMRGCFGDVTELLKVHGYAGRVNGFVLDIGVSSMQINEADRGFSFRQDGPLDMRMDTKDLETQTAADIVNTYTERDLADLIYKYGEERLSRRIAKAVVQRRKEKPFTRTHEFAECIRSVMPKKQGDKIDPATRTFQALRIAVNDELGELSRALEASENILAEGGRLVVVSFHSLEDGLVKAYLKQKSGRNPAVSRHLPRIESIQESVYTLPNRNKAIKPSEKETMINPRARSARMRCALRLSVQEKEND
ncbi:MAG: 16S rRNA (cytosine(1402)-N(4))-methyltransferase RsmH [Alphaproteobacteria bacterium]|nr:16S rRNA (cytosine(1402)-N(4))-methyltransferase RsmH [Alphaproteobacteria bacterium]